MASRLYGVDHIVAPMVETPYALSKFIEAKDKIYRRKDEGTKFLFNLETETTLRNLDAMIEAARGSVDGVVFGRVDFTLSRGMARDAINERSISEAVLRVAIALAEADLELVAGGAVLTEAISQLSGIQHI